MNRGVNFSQPVYFELEEFPRIIMQALAHTIHMTRHSTTKNEFCLLLTPYLVEDDENGGMKWIWRAKIVDSIYSERNLIWETVWVSSDLFPIFQQLNSGMFGKKEWIIRIRKEEHLFLVGLYLA